MHLGHCGTIFRTRIQPVQNQSLNHPFGIGQVLRAVIFKSSESLGVEAIRPLDGPSSPWQKSRGRRLRLWLGLFVVGTQRISFNTPRSSASIPSQIRGASPRGTFATGC
jgi:hypothetical protein